MAVIREARRGTIAPDRWFQCPECGCHDQHSLTSRSSGVTFLDGARPSAKARKEGAWAHANTQIFALTCTVCHHAWSVERWWDSSTGLTYYDLDEHARLKRLRELYADVERRRAERGKAIGGST